MESKKRNTPFNKKKNSDIKRKQEEEETGTQQN